MLPYFQVMHYEKPKIKIMINIFFVCSTIIHCSHNYAIKNYKHEVQKLLYCDMYLISKKKFSDFIISTIC